MTFNRAVLRLLQEVNTTDTGDDDHAGHDHGDHDHDDHGDEFDLNESSVDKPWGSVIGAAFLVQLLTFSGLLLLAFTACWQRYRKKNSDFNKLHNLIIPAFASGALLATTVFLLIPEALALLSSSAESHDEEKADEGDDEHDHDEHEEESHEDGGAFWKFGCSILGGFLFPILLSAIFPPPDVSQCEVCQDAESEVNDFDSDTERQSPSAAVKEEVKETVAAGKIVAGVTAKHPKNYALAASILLGDFCHNFTDGVFIGTAFLLCSNDLAWTITVATIYHEIAQEIADFALLTNHCGLSIVQALVANFVSGFSVLIGAVVVLSVDLSTTAMGSVLAISAGVYIYIAATECVPRIHAARKSVSDTLLLLLCFCVGAVPIGLVLLNHGHCEEGHDH